MIKKSTVHIVISLLLGFALGFFVHAKLVRAGFENMDQALPDILTRRLDLTSDQSQKVRQIIEESFKSFDALKTEIRPRMQELQIATRSKISAVLTDSQKLQFEKLTAEIEARRQERWGGDAPRPGPRRYAPF